MSAKRTLLLVLAAVLGTGLLYQACVKTGTEPDAGESGAGWFRRAPVEQPLEFDHQAHIEAEDMECLDCHHLAKKSRHAGLPKIKYCADCHSDPQGEHPEEPKVREYMEAKKEIPWKTLNKMPGHVYFSHQAHVAYAEMQCWDCHSDMRKVSKPVTQSDVDHLSMRKCMQCHEEKGVTLDCLSCHK